MASNRPESSSGGGSNTGAIAGGVVGGIAGLAILAALIFFCCKKKRNDKDFDFGDDTWDPAGAAYGGAAATSGGGNNRASSSGMRNASSGSVLRSSRYSNGSGVGTGAALGAAGAGAAAGAAAGYGASRRNRPADQQDNYYSSLGMPPPSREDTATPMSSNTFNTSAFGAGMAGVGAAHQQPQRHDPLYSGLANEHSGRNEGGWGVANQMRNSQQYNQGYGGSPERLSSGGGGMSSRVPPPPVSSAGGGVAGGIPYRLPSPDTGAPLSPPASLHPGTVASPAPSYRSIPGMGGMAWMPGLSSNASNAGGAHGGDERRSGQLRVMNEEPEQEERLDKSSVEGDSYEDDEQMRRAEEERRFGTRSGDAYDGLMDGLGRR